MNDLSASTFRRMFRFTRADFENLVALVKPHLESKIRSPYALSVTFQLAITLRWLAGGSFFQVVHLVLNALDFALEPIVFPTEIEELKKLELGFARLSKGVIDSSSNSSGSSNSGSSVLLKRLVKEYQVGICR